LAPVREAGPAETWDLSSDAALRADLVDLLAAALAAEADRLDAAVDLPSDKSPRGPDRTAAPGGALEPPSRLRAAVPGPTAAPADDSRHAGATSPTRPASTRRGDGVGDPVEDPRA